MIRALLRRLVDPHRKERQRAVARAYFRAVERRLRHEVELCYARCEGLSPKEADFDAYVTAEIRLQLFSEWQARVLGGWT